ncbi:MAG: nitroreductase family deazaflavin-dependent oxidoreductase [Acidobacteria bacterium]|nr:nitroreductase family deazaflavin-dependent oxidoreductase [Acidobacteriota bacterium]
MRVPQSLIDSGFKSLNLLHRTVLRATGRRYGTSAFGMPMVELHTTGRKSGLERTVILASPATRGSSLVLVASKGGDDRNPQWFENLVVHPDVELNTGKLRRPMRARVATAEEASELWPQIIASYRPYASYQRRAQREIPLVLCDPR